MSRAFPLGTPSLISTSVTEAVPFSARKNAVFPPTLPLVDIKEGVPKGKALDMMEAGPLRGYDTNIDGVNDIAAIAGSDVVVLAAGRVRKPGEERADVYQDNAGVVVAVCEQVRKLCPQAVVVNLVEPIDAITLLAQETLGFERTRVLGIGGLLTSTRVRHLVAQALGVSPRETTALVIGPHRGNMVVLKDTIRISGIPVAEVLGDERVDQMIAEARGAGDTILELAQASTAFYAPSAAAVSLVEAGAEKILELKLSDAERRAFDQAVSDLRTALANKPRPRPAN
jgi:malate dehydrogenase